MTIGQAERFYNENLKKYELEHNKDFLTWLKKITENGYKTFIDIKYLQEMINNIAFWYEIKYPEREIEFYEGISYFDFENIKSLSKHMDINQLMYRLPYEQLKLLKCNYRSTSGGITRCYNDKGKTINFKESLALVIEEKEEKNNIYNNLFKHFLIFANADNGIVEVCTTLNDIEIRENMSLEELLCLIKEKYSDRYDYNELECCIHNHNCDIVLRRQILQLVALKLLYSNRTTPERGYERARRFINEFNKKLGLDLSTEEIDEIISRDYSKKEVDESQIKKQNNFKVKCKNMFNFK